MINRPIPSSAERLPVIGLGTYNSFDVPDSSAYPALSEVLTVFNAEGGSLIDSSPMYGEAEHVIGALTELHPHREDFFYATKVWIEGRQAGIDQMEASMRKMKRPALDLIQIHNLVDWKTHLSTLRDWKAAGKVKYIGITHYTDELHGELEKIISTEAIDFVQFNYSILSRNAENRLLPVAEANGVATLINRPLAVGALFNRVAGKPVPAWANEVGILNWSSYFLKFLLGHTAVTCLIPATSNPAHAKDNFVAGSGYIPDEKMRKKMVEYLESL